MVVRAQGEETHLPLAWEVAITRRDTEDECVELGEFVGGNDGIVLLGRCAHLIEHLLREGLRDPVKETDSA